MVFTHQPLLWPLPSLLGGVRRSLLVTGGSGTGLSDHDVLGPYLGILYGHHVGHRGYVIRCYSRSWSAHLPLDSSAASLLETTKAGRSSSLLRRNGLQRTTGHPDERCKER